MLKSIGKSISLVLVAVFCIFSNLWISPAAIAFQSNQDLNQPATLVAPDPNFSIKIYDQPALGKKELGYGLSGDAVTVLQQVGSNNSQSWYLVKFDNEAKTEGWVSENYISVGAPVPPSSPSGQYLGNLSNQRRQQRQFSQQSQQQQRGSYNQS